MNKLLSKVYKRAKTEGRLCQRCGWIVTIKDWKHDEKLCSGCRDAAHGMVDHERTINYGKWLDEPIDKTGEML